MFLHAVANLHACARYFEDTQLANIKCRCKPNVLGTFDAMVANLIFKGNINGVIYFRKSISKRRERKKFF